MFILENEKDLSSDEEIDSDDIEGFEPDNNAADYEKAEGENVTDEESDETADAASAIPPSPTKQHTLR